MLNLGRSKTRLTMNSNNLLQIVQQGFRVTVGATAVLVETLQNPQKRTETLTSWQQDLQKYTQEWAEKGEITEQEARKFIENMWQNQGKATSDSTYSSSNTYTEGVRVNDSDTESEIRELTATIRSLKEELANLKASES